MGVNYWMTISLKAIMATSFVTLSNNCITVKNSYLLNEIQEKYTIILYCIDDL